MRFPILALLALCPSMAYASGKDYACDLGDMGRPRVVRVTKAGKLADTYVYCLRQGDGAALPLLGGEAEDSRGSGVQIECVDGKHRALAVFGEFMSAGYPQGWVMVYDPAKRSFERFGFAERAPPGWLYLGIQERLLVFAPGGRLETERRYLVYRFVVGADQDSTEAIIDALPETEGYEVIKIDW